MKSIWNFSTHDGYFPEEEEEKKNNFKRVICIMPDCHSIQPSKKTLLSNGIMI